ncbi:hypothetical protein BLA3211_04860 [Burkholderia aenigmatica]|uniref:Uncharacterized protein n=1 Tax=Burkholderia aenigmatica TaxID=2015348 RepID=A0A6J5J9V0_9BURK|nr:hypothetical protein BLA3211_04860 [Burkholderia aenigmatica]
MRVDTNGLRMEPVFFCARGAAQRYFFRTNLMILNENRLVPASV